MEGGRIFRVVLALCIYSCTIFVEAKWGKPTRNDLRITGGLCQTPWEGGCEGFDTRGLRNPNLYQKLGRTIPELLRKNWQPIFGRNPDCENGGKFNGFQWADPKQPPSVFLLLDIRGIVAGMQFMMPYSDAITPGSKYQYHKQPMMQNATFHGKDVYYITVYFMEPNLICSKGRSLTDLKGEGTVSRFFIQNGPSPLHTKRIPMTKAAAIRQGWAENNCFRGMGYHTFYDHGKWDSDGCTTFQPLAPFFDHSGDLNGFAFFVTGKASAHFLERPAVWMTEFITGKDNTTEATPKCLTEIHKAYGISGLHVYFTQRPYEFKCY